MSIGYTRKPGSMKSILNYLNIQHRAAPRAAASIARIPATAATGKTSFAAVAAKPVAATTTTTTPAAKASGLPTDVGTSVAGTTTGVFPGTSIATAATQPPTKKPPSRYPPLVVEVLPDWPVHFRELKKSLGYAPNGRPFGKGVRFIPKSDQEFRLIQRYLTQLEKEIGISWFWYSLPADRSVKVAIRGLPANTLAADVQEDLRELRYIPEHVRTIPTRPGRPGCLMFAQLQRTADIIPGIYEVAGVVGRADVLACVFFLSSILLYHGSSGRHRVWASVALAALSMLAKETGLTALLFNVAFDLFRCWNPNRSLPSVKFRWRSDSTCSRVIKALSALLLLVGARLAVLQGSLPAFSPQDNPPAFHPSFSVRLMTFCYLAAFNWWLLLCPWTLSHDWQMGSVPLITSWWDPRNLLTCAAFIALLALSYRCVVDLELQRHTPALVGLMLLVMPYLPASNLLVTVGFVVAERVLYIPSVGSVIITVYGVQLMWRRGAGGRLLILGVAVMVAAGVARTHLRNRDWRTRETLLRADLSVLPHNAKLHYNFANFLKDIEQQENAVKHYKEALRLWPSYASAHNNLGTLVLASGKAEHHFLQALKYNRDHVNAHYNLAKLYRKKNRLPESLKMLERCISLEPRFVQAYLELLLLKPEEEKREVLDKIIDLEPKNWEHYVLYGNWYRDRGLLPLSLEYYTSAMRLSFSTESGGRRGEVLSLREACLALRTLGQYSRILQLVIRWHSVRGDGPPARRRVAAARAWRLRSELAERAALYARPVPRPDTITSTCLHHSQLEISHEQSQKLKEDNLESRLIQETISTHSSLTNNGESKNVDKNNCQKSINSKKSVSLSSQYKLTHNKSEIGHKKSCPLHKKKKIKKPDFTPYVADHLIKTY